MSHINGDITRTRELLSQAVQHLDNVNARRNPPNSGTQGTGGNSTRTPIGSASSHASLHYSTIPKTSNFASSERRALFRPNTRTFHPSFHPANPAKRRKKLATWQHDFVCLSSTTDSKIPSNMDKAELIRAGLGLKQLQFFLHGDSSDFYAELSNAYPKLSSGGGFELLRTPNGNSKELVVIPPPSGGYTVSHLKSIMGQAKVYIRPMQRNLSMEILHCDEEVC